MVRACAAGVRTAVGLLVHLSELAAQEVGPLEGGGVFPHGAFTVKSFENKVVPVHHFQGIEEPFHGDLCSGENFSSVSGADGDEYAATYGSVRLAEGLFEDVPAGPEDLAAIDEQFCLGAVGHKVDRAGQNEPVGGEQLGVELLHVVIEGATTMFRAVVALGTREDVELGEAGLFEDVVGRGLAASDPGVADAAQKLIEQQVGVAAFAGTAGQCQDVHNSPVSR